MKITATTELPTTIPAILSSRARNASPDSDLISKRSSRKPPRRKARTPAGGARLKRDGAAGGRRSRPETPLLRWKFDDIEREKDANVLDVDEKIAPEHGRRSGRKVRKGREVTVSSRRLASGLWRLQLPGVDAAHGGRWSRQKSEDRLGFEPGIDRVRTPFPCQSNTKAYDSEAKDLLQSPHSMHHHKSGFLCRVSVFSVALNHFTVSSWLNCMSTEVYHVGTEKYLLPPFYLASGVHAKSDHLTGTIYGNACIIFHGVLSPAHLSLPVMHLGKGHFLVPETLDG
ncbi:hypothetical protein CK203_021485 [Vitis vinifera]|uniref:Uncharacterized protein n=1 Tax=Vitis vinifera TaxID=29760 RepID=A0A438IS46_VITVI|nr:hypothetical protein CK203_021485 [Vitis vinifera]